MAAWNPGKVACWQGVAYGVTLDTLSVEDTGCQHIDLHTGNSGDKISKYEALPENQRPKGRSSPYRVLCQGCCLMHLLFWSMISLGAT